jgi:hypothetical protein
MCIDCAVLTRRHIRNEDALEAVVRDAAREVVRPHAVSPSNRRAMALGPMNFKIGDPMAIERMGDVSLMVARHASPTTPTP